MSFEDLCDADKDFSEALGGEETDITSSLTSTKDSVSEIIVILRGNRVFCLFDVLFCLILDFVIDLDIGLTDE